MKITVLVENTVSTKAPAGLLGQHGLSLLLEMPEGERMLLDAGQTYILAENMLLMDIVPDSIDYIVLSHGHFDHCGGLQSFFKARRLPAPVFAGPGIFAGRYAGGGHRFIGVPYSEEHLAACGAKFIFDGKPRRLLKDVWLSGFIPQNTDFEGENQTLLGSDRQPDRFTDETAIYLVRPEGLVVITGCAHRGLINTIKHGQQVTGLQKVYAVIGGSHLEAAAPWRQAATIQALLDIEPALIALNHCTGIELQGRLKSIFGDRFVFANTGSIIEI